ncbi:substrate-binding domain-containing protein [Paenibacillus sp. CGMCC 1.16610]|uniref:Substrate-binding domain-containing protein n=1 Tax=Paenibacillus anseongense TaxID=2682845 RepID=A0ABW9UL64_9BACL|nr:MULTISPECIES: substrate-binding domain-containing protein [Paenibacillus]MBA2936748.1 substrate-binding domain-containing protein [Paenibacillus sp. CGMCC 1.16610]MVQ39741.1 substrate-binding domain-containing protein [Paenibacillus anseongense]
MKVPSKKGYIWLLTFSLIGLVVVMLVASLLHLKAVKDEPDFLIGISQPNLNEPRQLLMNNEIRKEAEKHKNVKLIFTDAAENSEKQVHDVQKLMKYGIDLLIISLNDSEKLTPIVTEVYKDIPVIVLGRGVTGYDYSLFIGSDNLSIGKKSGKLAADLLGGSPADVVEIKGAVSSRSVEETSRGFRDYLSQSPSIQVDKVIVGDWQRDRTEDELKRILPSSPGIKLVFAHSDAMALGAYRAIDALGLSNVQIIGIDGLDTVNGGFDLVKQGVLSGTVTSPTGGRESIQYALDILNREKVIPKKIILPSHVITQKNTRELGAASDPSLKQMASRMSVNPKKMKLGVAVVGSESSWRAANTESIKNAAAQDLGIDLIMQNAEGSQDKQIEIIRSFIQQRVDVIAFTPIVESGWDDVLAEAKVAGIPVILTDRKVKLEDDSLWTTFIGSDFVEEGRRAARWLVEHKPVSGETQIVELQGTAGSAPAIERRQGFEEVLTQNAGFRVIASEVGDFTTESGQQLMSKVLQQGAIPQVVFAHNDDMALGAIKAIEQMGLKPGKDIIVISVDATKLAFQAMLAGKLNMSVECNPLLGPQIIKAAKDLATGKEIPVNIITAESIFSQETAKRDVTTRKY